MTKRQIWSRQSICTEDLKYQSLTASSVLTNSFVNISFSANRSPHTNGKFYKHICKEMKLTSLIMKQIYFLCYTAAFIFHRNTGTVLSMRTPLSFRKIKERFTSYPNLFIIAHLSSGTNYGQSAFCQNVVLWYLSSQP